MATAKKTTVSGAIEVIDALRKATMSSSPSRLDAYISQSKEENKNHLSPETQNEQAIPLQIVHSEIKEIETSLIIRWKYKDRPDDELGDIASLAESIKSIGQQQPCIVRLSADFPGKYELIAGERRWRAAESIGVKLKAIVQDDIDDRLAALIQATENENRLDLSDFAKGLSFADKIERGIITQKDLVSILGISQQRVTSLLSYKRIPQVVFDAIGDFKKVSSRTAEEIARQAAKGEIHIAALIELTPRIRAGKCGHNTIKKELEKIIHRAEKESLPNKKVVNTDGRHLFTWRLDNNAAPSIHFPKDIIKLIDDNVINFEELTQELKEVFARKLAYINET